MNNRSTITLAEYLAALYPPWTPGALLAYVKEPFIRRFGYGSGLPKFAETILGLDAAGYDVYLGINSLDGKSVQSRGPHARGTEAEVASVVALVADVDAAGKDGHNYPTQARILEALDAMPLAPSIIVVSGRQEGGLHVYWLLDEPFVVKTDDDRRRIKATSTAWQRLLKAKLHPFDLDSTFDLVRVLRPIGTINHKYGSVVSAMLFEPELRYCPQDFEQHLPKPETKVVTTMPVSIDMSSVTDRARKYVARIPGAVAGQRGHDRTFNVACVLVLGFGLSVDQAFRIFAEWNQTCDPPWSEGELRHKLANADARQDRRGYLLDDRQPFDVSSIIHTSTRPKITHLVLQGATL